MLQSNQHGLCERCLRAGYALAAGDEVHELGPLLRVAADADVDVPAALHEVCHEVQEGHVDVRRVLAHCGAQKSAHSPAHAWGHIRVWLLTDISIEKP
jgi:hypothetical protein